VQIRHFSVISLFLLFTACGNPENDKKQLIDASISGNSETIKELLDAQVDPNSRDKCQWTPLMQATMYNHPKIVKTLLEQGAQTELQDQAGYTPLLIAATHNRDEIMLLLMRYGANINHQEQDGGMTALMIAAKAGHLKTSQILLQFKADTKLIDKQGLTALQWAHRNKHIAITKLIK